MIIIADYFSKENILLYRNDPNVTALQSNTSSLLLLKARRSRP
jgi:hypothetical protein